MAFQLANAPLKAWSFIIVAIVALCYCIRSDVLSEAARVWVDILPREVCQQIACSMMLDISEASNFVRPFLMDSLLSLGETSPTQRETVLSMFQGEFWLDEDTGHNAEHWLQLLGSNLRYLHLLQEGIEDSVAIAYLKVPSLYHLHITDCKLLWAAKDAMPALRRLDIELDGDQDVRRLLQTFSQLRLYELKMDCMEQCVFRTMEKNRSAWVCLPTVVCCEVTCLHEAEQCVRTCENEPVSEWPFFGSLPGLRKLTLGCSADMKVNPDALPQLKALESVKIKWANLDHLGLASQIGESVRELDICGDSALNANDISKLSACPRLSLLDVTIWPGAEVSLPVVASALRTLKINVMSEGQEALSEWEPGLMLRIVLKAKHLRHIRVTQVRVSAQELAAVLKQIGTRLEHFGTSVGGQGEPTWVRLIKLMRSMSEYNVSLQEFDGDLHWASVEEVSDTQARDLLVALRNLVRRAPGLMTSSAWSVDILVRFIIKHQCDSRRCPALRELPLSFALAQRRLARRGLLSSRPAGEETYCSYPW